MLAWLREQIEVEGVVECNLTIKVDEVAPLGPPPLLDQISLGLPLSLLGLSLLLLEQKLSDDSALVHRILLSAVSTTFIRSVLLTNALAALLGHQLLERVELLVRARSSIVRDRLATV